MRKDPIDPSQNNQYDRASRQRLGAHGLSMYLTPVRAVVGMLALALLLISATGALIFTTHSDAATTTALDTCTTSTPATGSTTTTGATATATPRHHRTPVTTPTDGTTPDPTDTSTPVTPTDTPTPVTPTDTPTPVTPTDTPTDTSSPQSSRIDPFSADSIVMLSMKIHLTDAITSNAAAQCTSTTAPTGSTQTPGSNSTATATGSTSGATPVTTIGSTPGATPVTITSGSQAANAANNGGSRIVLIVGSVFLLLLVGLGAGWFFFRHMLLPESAANPNLPPSGARPWSRTRVPNPDSVNGIVNGPVALSGGPGGPGPNMSTGPSITNGYNGSAGPGGFSGPVGISGAGFGGLSDGFIPPSQQIFPQNENSMIPPGSGAFPVITNANGFTPASPAFNAMYGLPDDPFTDSQAGTSGWMANLGGNNDFNSTPTTAPNGGSFVPDQIDLNDPYLAEVIRQYSQKSHTVQRKTSPDSPVSPIPQSELRKNFQDSN